MNKSQTSVLRYYKNLESKLGYTYITRETKHFGFYPEAKATISEHEAQEEMSDLVAKNLQLQPNQHVLDAGCGYGIVSCYLAQKYKIKTIGIDLNDFEIKKAQEKAKNLHLTDAVKFQIMDYSQTNFPKNNFDALFGLIEKTCCFFS